jgi:hypothetical protein
MIVTREDLFREARIHTIAWSNRDTPCWYAPEIEIALDAELVHLGVGWIDGVDFASLDGDEAFELYEALGKTQPAERPLPAVVLFPTGLTLACVDRAQGAELRRLLVGEAAEGVREELGRTRLEREIAVLYRDEEMQDRARKALAVHRAVEAARRSGHLALDDAGYAECMAGVAELATGVRFPVRANEDLMARGPSVALDARARATKAKPDSLVT